MKSVSVSEAKDSLNALLRDIRGGATIIITDRGIPVARLTATVAAHGLPAAALDLAQHGRLVLPERQPSAKWLDMPRPKARGTQRCGR
jgi:antitoxin (DNA-binding transcriptional repressor) of toxin-antitoxin stability system